MSYSEQASKAMLRKAKEKLASAKDDYKSGRYDSCISNLYYSAFQTVSALLIIRCEYVNKHTHVRGFVNKELANKGLITKESAKLYNKLMDYRSDADYNSEVFFDRNLAEEVLKGVEQFNLEIEKMIEKEIRTN
ncbi:HEPN domain-containing protein [Ammoniphilus sp. YIM 78166]|uniref:HEPN domain-containing protein n=1 Tax=Ammoniphilus sp. YIM 78166 TaxID=1644106 RepID=UPI00106FB88F|nr:HEPN domain-containing protein [Ammoniphilus sp. YIM 78166]